MTVSCQLTNLASSVEWVDDGTCVRRLKEKVGDPLFEWAPTPVWKAEEHQEKERLGEISNCCSRVARSFCTHLNERVCGNRSRNDLSVDVSANQIGCSFYFFSTMVFMRTKPALSRVVDKLGSPRKSYMVDRGRITEPRS